MSIPVIGRAGYVGLHRIHKLLELGHFVDVIDNLEIEHAELAQFPRGIEAGKIIRVARNRHQHYISGYRGADRSWFLHM